MKLSGSNYAGSSWHTDIRAAMVAKQSLEHNLASIGEYVLQISSQMLLPQVMMARP